MRICRVSFSLGLALTLCASVVRGAAQELSPSGGTGRPASLALSAPETASCPTAITESSSLAFEEEALSCNNGDYDLDNSYYRAFSLPDFGISGDFSICSVTIGVGHALTAARTGQPIAVMVYTTSAHPFTLASLTLIGTTSVTVQDQANTLLSIPVAALAPAGSEIVVEVFTPNGRSGGNFFFMGANSQPQTGPSYFRAPDCGIPNPVDLAAVGLPDDHLIMQVFGGEFATSSSALTVDPHGNGVLEIGETVEVRPAWHNGSAVDYTLSGEASKLTGPGGGPLYFLIGSAGEYGSIAAGTTQDCSAGGSCYALDIEGSRPAQHFDATFDEVVSASGAPSATKVWTLHVVESFEDVPKSSAFYHFAENIFHNGVTGGCGNGDYCPSDPVTRGQMAVFLLKAKGGAPYTPPPCTTQIFGDVPCSNGFAPWINELSARSVTAGCAGGNYCPGDPVTRAQMSVFLLRTKEGAGYTPPPCTTDPFVDVPCSSGFAPWIQELVVRGITAGCGGGRYCAGDQVTRGQMAVFLVTTYALQLYGP